MNDGWKFACVARLDPSAKGQDLLLQIMSSNIWRERPVHLNLFGKGPCEYSLRQLSTRLGVENVTFRGHVSEIDSIWDENHLLLLPSRYEGLPLALVEAMWSGRASVVTDVGGNAEACVDGETGFVASGPNLISFSSAMEKAWVHRDELRSMGFRARLRAESLIPRDPDGEFYTHVASCI